MEPSHETRNIYQLRIVLRGISPLIWRRVLVRDDTTFAQLHDLIPMLLQWRHEHLYDFHIYLNVARKPRQSFGLIKKQ